MILSDGRAMDIVDIGKEGESHFKALLDKCSMPYMLLEQSKANFPQAFYEQSPLKRPDFLIAIKGFGMMVVDVKHYVMHIGEQFKICRSELQKASSFKSMFNLPWFWVFKNNDSQIDIWYFVNIDALLFDSPVDDIIVLDVKDMIKVEGNDLITLGFANCLCNKLD